MLNSRNWRTMYDIWLERQRTMKVDGRELKHQIFKRSQEQLPLHLRDIIRKRLYLLIQALVI